MSEFSRYTLFFISFVFANENHTVWSINTLGSRPEVKRFATTYELSFDNHVSTYVSKQLKFLTVMPGDKVCNNKLTLFVIKVFRI